MGRPFLVTRADRSSAGLSGSQVKPGEPKKQRRTLPWLMLLFALGGIARHVERLAPAAPASSPSPSYSTLELLALAALVLGVAGTLATLTGIRLRLRAAQRTMPTVTPTHLELSTRRRRSVYPWIYLRELREQGPLLLIQMLDRGWIAVPRRALTALELSQLRTAYATSRPSQPPDEHARPVVPDWPHHQITFAHDLEDLVEYRKLRVRRWRHWTSFGNRSLQRLLLVMIPTLIALAGAVELSASRSLGYLVPGVVIALFGWGFLRRVTSQDLTPEQMEALLRGPRTFGYGPDLGWLAWSGVRAELPWTSVARWIETGRLIVLSADELYLIPKRTFATAEALEEFRALLREKVGAEVV